MKSQAVSQFIDRSSGSLDSALPSSWDVGFEETIKLQVYLQCFNGLVWATAEDDSRQRERRIPWSTKIRRSSEVTLWGQVGPRTPAIRQTQPQNH